MKFDFFNKATLLHAVILTLRMTVGGIFIYSGFVKAIDIWGLEYKIGDYLNAFQWNRLMPFSGFFSAVLPIFEFVMGAMLLLGSFRRASVIFLLACMAFMLPLTAYIWIADPVSDCGCFGDALTISNGATFAKNIFVTIALLFLLRYNKRLRSIYGPAVQWLTAVIPSLFIIIVAGYGNYVQPMLDFRPYPIGIKIATENNGSTDTEFLFTYTKNGEQRDFTADNLPDTSWTFVDRHPIPDTQTPASATDNPQNPIAIFDGNQPTDDIIPTQGETLLLLIPDIAEINALTNFNLNDLNDLSTAKGVVMICLTSSSDNDIRQWRELSMSGYPVYKMDDSQLKSVARGNPAILYIKDGTIRYKSTFDTFFNRMEEQIENNQLNLQPLESDNSIGHDILISLTTMLLIAMTALFLINRTHLLIKFGLRQRKNQNKSGNFAENLKISKTLNNFKMRKNIVAGNWKMNTTLQEGVKLATEVNEALKNRNANCDVVIGVPFTHLASVKAVINENLGLAAENCADKAKGAYTGEVSASMVASTGATYVILGHSERRQYYHETSEILKEKTELALANGLTPIFCIGEVLEERENGTYFDVVKKQVEEALFSLSAEDFSKIVLAYEPVWAIGTGKTATADQAEEIHAFIRKTIADKYGAEVAENTSILYGGSCKPSNAKEIFSKPNVDGGLIGGAALEAESFMGIVDAF